MNNYPSTGRARPRFPSYRDQRKDFIHDRFHGSQDRGRSFFEQRSQPPFGQRESLSAIMSSPYPSSSLVEEDSVRHSTFPNYNGHLGQNRYGHAPSQYDRKETFRELASSSFQNTSLSRLSPLYSERDSLERVPFSNMLKQRECNSPLSDIYDSSSTAFPASRQHDLSPTPYILSVPTVDSALREKFQNHMKIELQKLSQDDSHFLRRSNPSYQGDSSYLGHSRDLDQARFDDLPPQNSLLTFKSDYSKGFQDVVEHSKFPAWNNEVPQLALGNKPLFPSAFNCNNDNLSEDLYASSNSLMVDNGPSQIDLAQTSKQNLNLPVENNSSSKPLTLDEVEKNDVLLYSEKPVINTEKPLLNTEVSMKDSSVHQSVNQKYMSLTHEPVFKTNSLMHQQQFPNSSVFSLPHKLDANSNKLQTEICLENSSDSNALPQATASPKKVNKLLPVNSDSVNGSVDNSSSLGNFEDNSVNKVLEVGTKCNSSVLSSSSVLTDDWPTSHSIPFLGEATSDIDSVSIECKLSTKCYTEMQETSEGDDSILSATSQTKSGENDKIKSTLEDALETLMIKDPIVGLDCITEYKDIISVDGGFPFYCTLCKSSISRSLIIEHIQGFKHRFKYLKLKDSASCEHIANLFSNQSDKDQYVCKESERLEKTYGRGNVVVKLKSSDVKKPLEIRFGKVTNKVLCDTLSNKEEPFTSEPFTIKEEQIHSPGSIDGNVYELQSSKPCPSIPTPKEEPKDEVKEHRKPNFILNKASEEQPSEFDAKVTKQVKNERKWDKLENDLQEKHSDSNDGVVKRPGSPLGYPESKSFKQDMTSSLNSQNADPVLLSNSGETSSQSQDFSPLLFEQLSKYMISTDAEADVVLKSIDILMKSLLRYKLQHIADEDVENLIKSLDNGTVDKMDKIMDLMKSKTSETCMDENSKLRLNSDFSIKGKENLESNNVFDVQGVFPNSVEITNHSHSIPDVGKQNTQMLHGVSHANTNVQSNMVPKFLPNKALNVKSPSTTAGAASATSWLQPPPFFQWSETPTSAVSGSHMQNNMVWNNAYQSSLAPMTYYQQPGYPTVPAMYQGYPMAMSACMPVDSSLIQPPLPLTEMAVLPPPPPPANPLSKPPPPPPPSDNFTPKPPPPPSDSPLCKPPLPASVGSIPRPPPPRLPPPPRSSILPPLPPPIG